MSDNNYLFPTPNGGFLLSTQNIPNGNMAYATAMYLFLAQMGEDDRYDPNLLAGLIDLEQPVASGLLSRFPDTKTNTSIDDYLAVACIEGYALDMFARSKKTWGFYDLTSPFKPSWNWAQFLWRWPHFPAHVRISAGKRMWPWHRLGWAAYLFYGLFQPMTNQDYWIQSHLLILTAKRRGYRSLLGALAISIWRRRKSMKTYDIMKAYLNLDEHPLLDAWEPYD